VLRSTDVAKSALVLVVWAVWAPGLGAQGQAPESTSAVTERVTIRPTAELRELATRVARMLAIRSPVPFDVGEPPPGDMPEAISRGQLAMAVDDDALRILFMTHARSYATELSFDPDDRQGMVRAVALAIESLLDTVQTTDAGVGPAGVPDGEETFIGPMFAEQEIEPIARPTLVLRLMVGYSPSRETVFFGPGVGLGLCVGDYCAVVEGDLPIQAETVEGVTYRAVTLSERFQWRPLVFGDFAFGPTFGFLTRIGNASTGTESASATDFGLRATLEGSWRFWAPFEAVLEAGTDYAVTRARYVRTAGDSVFLEDRWTPWVVTALRVRP